MNKRIKKKRKKQVLKRLGKIFSKYYKKQNIRIPIVNKEDIPVISKEEMEEWGRKLKINPLVEYHPYLIDPEEDKNEQ